MKNSYIFKHILVLGFICFDIAINTTVDHSDQQTYVIGLTAVQAVIRLCSLFIIFMFMWPTFAFRYGLLGVLCSQFKLLFLMFPVSLVFTIALRVRRIVEVGSSSTLQIWNQDYYVPLFVVHNLLSCIYYMLLLQAAFQIADPNFYKPNVWLQR